MTNSLTSKATDYYQWAHKCIWDAYVNKSHIDPYCMKIDGMSSYGMRHLLNNLLSYKEPLRYLEIGSWRGSTFCSAICHNDIEAISIDNFSEFGGVSFAGEVLSPRDDFKKNLRYILDVSRPKPRVTFYEEDSFNVDVSKLGKIDVYFYDGEHSYDSQYKAFTYYNNCLNDYFITLVDDYNVDPSKNMDVENATQKAFKDLGYKIIHDWVLITRNSDDIQQARDQWWNNVYVAVIKKP